MRAPEGCKQHGHVWANLQRSNFRRAISVLFGINRVRNKRSHLVGPPFPVFKARFSATACRFISEDLTRCLLMGGCGQSHISEILGEVSITTT